MCVNDFINVLNGYCTISVQIAQNNNECIYIGLAMELEKEEILEKEIKEIFVNDFGHTFIYIWGKIFPLLFDWNVNGYIHYKYY